MNEVNGLFTKENVEKIYVPDIVKDDPAKYYRRKA